MIELIIKKHIEDDLGMTVLFELPPKNAPDRLVVIGRTGGKMDNHLLSAIFTFQSYAESLYEASVLNEKVKKSVNKLIVHDEISSVKLNSDYVFTDTETKQYRYQAVYDIYYYDEQGE